MVKRTDFLVKPFLFLLILLVLSEPVSAEESTGNELLFILGMEYNELALQNASLDAEKEALNTCV